MSTISTGNSIPHRWRGPQAVILKPHTTWSTLGDSSNPLALLNNTNTQNNTAEIVSLFMSLYVIAHLWIHCQELSLAILPSLLSWTWALQRWVDQSPLVCGGLVPPLLVVPCLMFFHPQHCIWSEIEPCTIHKHRWHKHTPVPTYMRGTQTETTGDHMYQYLKNQWFTWNIETSIFHIGNSSFWSSNVKYREVHL